MSGPAPEPAWGLLVGEESLSLDYITGDMERNGALRLGPPFLRDSAELRPQVRRSMVVDSPWLGPLFWGSIFTALPAAFLAWTGGRARAWAAPPVALSSIAAYVSYERLLSPVYNIRIDVLFAWPIVGLAAAAFVKRCKRPGSTAR